MHEMNLSGSVMYCGHVIQIPKQVMREYVHTGTRFCYLFCLYSCACCTMFSVVRDVPSISLLL